MTGYYEQHPPHWTARINAFTALRDNARISNLELADLVGLSATPCARRVKRLEIADYQGHITNMKPPVYPNSPSVSNGPTHPIALPILKKLLVIFLKLLNAVLSRASRPTIYSRQSYQTWLAMKNFCSVD